MESLIRSFALAAALAMTTLAPVAALAQATEATQESDAAASSSDSFAGAVFAMTNETAANRIVSYGRARDGSLTRLGRIFTRGLGIGVDTDTQGPLRLSADNRFLYAVNPGSDNVSVFAVHGTRLRFLQIVDAGDQPLALTLRGRLLYVLNGSVAGNGIRGFRIASNGTLRVLPDSFRLLSSPIAVPGDVAFSPDGKVILVTHKTTNVLLPPENAIDAFAIGADGYASALPIRNASFGLRPFSLAFRDDGRLVVVEANNAALNLSSASWYRLNADRTISSFHFRPSGTLDLIDGDAAFLGDVSQPVDLSLGGNGRFLYQLLRGTGAVAAFRIENNGSLTSLGLTTGGLPVADGASGLASYEPVTLGVKCPCREMMATGRNRTS